MKKTTKGYEVITRLWNAEKGGTEQKSTTFDNVKAAFTFANNFISANSQREKGEVEVWVYDNEDNNDIFRMVNGRKAYGKPVMIGNRSAQRVDYKAIMEEVISETENAAAENAENKVDIAALEKELRGIKVYTDKCKRDIAYYAEQIIGYYGYIAKCENAILQAHLDSVEVEKEAAVIEAAIANQKVIDATDEIVTAAAIDVSVAAMEEINAAIDFSAEVLMAAIAQVEKAVKIVPVTFELQHFAEDIVTADSVATIDTALSNAVISPINELDEDIKLADSIKESFKDYAYFSQKAVAIEKQIEDLRKQLAVLEEEAESSASILRETAKYLEQWTLDELKHGEFSQIAIHTVDGEILNVKSSGTNITVTINLDTGGIELYDLGILLAEYSTVKQFKAVIRELAAAIERGNTEFTFPADIPLENDIPLAFEDIPFGEDDWVIGELDEKEIAASLWF